jgi:hypothetical protein
MAEKTQIVITAKDETGAAINSARRGLASLSGAAEGLRNSFSFLGTAGGLAGLLGGVSVGATVKAAIDDLDKLNDSVERLGISAEDLSALNFAGKLNGIEAEDMTMALTKLSVKMQEAASGSKEAAALFADLGVKVTDSSGKLKSADQVFAEVADSFAQLEDGAGKTALAVDTFGKTGAKLVPVLNGGADGLAKMRKEAEQLGAIIGTDLSKQAAEFNDNLDRLSVVSGAAARSITSLMLPSLIEFSSELLVAIKNSDGLLDAFLRYGAGKSFNFKTPTESLAALNVEASKLEDRLSIGRGEKGDDERLRRLQQEISYYSTLDKLKTKADEPANTGGTKPVVRTPTGDGKGKTGGAKAQADEALRLIQSLDEQIALKSADAESTDKMTAAEVQAVKVRYQLEAGTLKATAAQRDTIFARLDSLAVLEKELAKQKEFADALAKQEESNVKSNQAMIEQIATAERAAELYGLTESQISVVEQARLADAIAIAKENGATEAQIAYLEQELELRGKLSDSLIKVDTKKQEKADAEDAIKKLDEMGEFAKQAAKNMQDAMADFFIDPTKGGIQSIAETFAQTLQKMIAQAAAAQLGKLLFGDLDKTGNLSGLAGKGLDWLSGLFSFEKGGIMTSAGAVPLHKYSMGGIANSPQLAMFGEGRTPEAYVPLPDGRRIPVHMQGGGGGMNITQHISVGANADRADVKRAAASGARSVLALQNGARRYG